MDLVCLATHAKNDVELAPTNAPALPEGLPKRSLNPQALAFISRSSSDSSPGPASDADPQEAVTGADITRGPVAQSVAPLEHQDRAEPEDSRSSACEDPNHPRWGWESPQGVLPSSPHHPVLQHPMSPPPTGPQPASPPSGHPTPTPWGRPAAAPAQELCTNADPADGQDAQSATDDASSSPSWREGASSPPPPFALHAHTVLHTYPPWTQPFPIYVQYSPEAAAAGLDAGSPHAAYPAGGSPPLAPGFISIAMPSSASGAASPPHPSALMYHHMPPPHPYGPAMYGSSPPHSMGSSPPHAHGQFFYLPHGPAPAEQHGNGPPDHHPHPHHTGRYPHAGTSPPGPPFHPPQHAAGTSPQGRLNDSLAGLSLAQQGRAGEGAGAGAGVPPPALHGGMPGKSQSRASARIARSHRAGGSYNPAEFEFDVEEAEAGGPGGRTTVMMRNIPNKYTQSTMLSMLAAAGFAGRFDFFYLPIDFRNRCGLGYAFINMLQPQDAGRLYRAFHACRWEEHSSRKVCEVRYARVQGRDALVEHFRAAKFPSEEAQYHPLVFRRQPVKGEDGEESENAPGSEEGCQVAAVDPLPLHQFLARLE